MLILAKEFMLMRPHEKVNLIFGSTMVIIYLFGGVFVIMYAEKLMEKPRTAEILGWVMIAYSFLRALRVYEGIKKWKNERKDHTKRHL
ncbi:hypothetical protein [Raineya orbicola]|nr:hypothetical protein [Raineya orbicola]